MEARNYIKFFKTDSKAAKALKDGTALKMKDADLMVTMKKLYSEIAEKINVEAYNLEVDNKIRDANNKLAEDKNALKDYEIKQGPKLIAYLREYQKQTGIAKESGKWLSMDF